jgi:hypothetical protein
MNSGKSHANCGDAAGTEQWASAHNSKSACNADNTCGRCSDLAYDDATACGDAGETWSPNQACNWFQNCSIANLTTQADCEAADPVGSWSVPITYTDCRQAQREWIPNHSDPEDCIDANGGFDSPGRTACNIASDDFYTIPVMVCSNGTSTTRVACEALRETWAVKTTGCTTDAIVNTWVEPRGAYVHGTPNTDDCTIVGDMYSEMAGYKRLDQSVFGYCSNTTYKAEGDCTGGGGTWYTNKCAIGLKQSGSCSDGSSPTEAVCLAASETWTKTTDAISEFETTSTDDLLGYIALKYTDMFGGEYFTRPILIDVSNSAKHSTYTQLEANQDQGTKYYGGSRTSNVRGTTANGSCSFTGYTTQHDCHNAGGAWTPEADGFYLSGELANDDQKRGVLLQFTADRIRDALQDLPNFAIPKVNVTNYIDSHSGIPWGNAFDITFTDSSTSGKQNLLECVYQGHECNGSQPKMSSWAVSVEKGSHTEVDTVGSTRVTRCAVWEVVETGKTLEENASCGNRGLCDTSTGICQCFEGHTGENCGTQTIFF